MFNKIKNFFVYKLLSNKTISFLSKKQAKKNFFIRYFFTIIVAANPETVNFYNSITAGQNESITR
jgi:hypothetical protein